MKLKPETQINAICIVNKDKSGVILTNDINMSLLEWTLHHSMSDLNLQTKLPTNLLDVELSLKSKGITHTSTGVPFHSTYYHYEDENIIIAVNVIDWIGDLVESN